jgi:hypothetical protein
VASAAHERAAQRYPGNPSNHDSGEDGGVMQTRTVAGKEFVPLGIIARRTIYGFTPRGEAYRLTPDTGNGYLLRRPSDGFTGIFATLEDAVAYVSTLETENG